MLERIRTSDAIILQEDLWAQGEEVAAFHLTLSFSLIFKKQFKH